MAKVISMFFAATAVVRAAAGGQCEEGECQAEEVGMLQVKATSSVEIQPHILEQLQDVRIVKEGEFCADSRVQCEAGTVCTHDGDGRNSYASTCRRSVALVQDVRIVKEGEFCADSRVQCEAGTECTHQGDGRNGYASTCQRAGKRIVKEGEFCADSRVQCEAGTVCTHDGDGRNSYASTCRRSVALVQDVRVVKEGEFCTDSEQCEAGTVCTQQGDGHSRNSVAICQRAGQRIAKVGQPCADSGVQCESGMECRVDGNGRNGYGKKCIPPGKRIGDEGAFCSDSSVACAWGTVCRYGDDQWGSELLCRPSMALAQESVKGA